MFADVAGSTRLYEQLGDILANSIISEVIDLMVSSTTSNTGKVIKTIGDEVMCRFDDANDAANAAVEIQEKLQFGSIQGTYVSVKVGFHTGKVIQQVDGDLFGDAVNLAARLVGVAKGRQIILSKETLDALNPSLNPKVRHLDWLQVKGKSEPISVNELVWETAGVTQMVSFDALYDELKQELTLQCNGTNYSTDTDGQSVQLGRSEECDLVVGEELASRFHAKIRSNRGHFVLTDQSTNGTYVQSEDGNINYLRRDELVLEGKGRISLGSQISGENNRWWVNFHIKG
jgi:hypothetical protein